MRVFSEKNLQNKDDLFSILNDEFISETQYVHGIKVWNTFKLKNMGEFHDLYLKSDVLSSADIFEDFRKACMQYYKIDSLKMVCMMEYLT